jgi:predicted Zn finger-like uncharacterized protein
MYTQCPECEVAFRVTAEVLKQAAGKVRCGGCGVAFNALAHLSEEMPVAPVGEDQHPDPHPLEIESNEPGELVAGTPPKSISAQQSAALLKTLDELAGEDIRIEDTGVEWRVMDVDDEDGELADDPVPSMVHEEMRFDDNTPLPDDFDLDAPSAPHFEPVAVAVTPEPTPSDEESHIDLAFGEADEWEDLLDDLEEAAVSASTADEPAENQSDGPVEETDNSAVLAALPDVIEIKAPEAADEEVERPLDMDTQFALQAKEMGIDLSSVHAVEDGAVEEEEEEVEVEVDEERETSIDEDLIAAAFEVEATAKAEASGENEADMIELEEFKLNEIESEETKPDEVNLEDVPAEELTRAGILDEDDFLDVITEEDELAEDEVLDDLLHEDALEDQILERALMGETVPDEELVEEEIATEEPPEEELVEEMLPDEAALEADLEQALEGLIEDSDNDDIALSEFTEPEQAEVPEPTEDERTLNLAIDHDLLAIAVEDDDGFTSTIVQKQLSGANDIPDENEPLAEEASDQELSDEDAADETPADEELAEKTPADLMFTAAARDDNPLMETIIMEGESVHNEEELERLEAARKAASLSLKESGFDRDKENIRHWQPPKHSMTAAAALLFVILIVQLIHHSREALAISPTFQSTIGPLYRMVGSPVTPAWDIKGWRFEATKGSTDEDNQVLTIYSRVGNKSDQILPYPLVHVSLTDRFEEIIGSRVLEPSEYLFDNADPRRPVSPNETFNAVIAIDSPSADATGFKLNVCYRLESGQLRCAIEDFK